MLASGQMALGTIGKATHHQMCLEMLASNTPTNPAKEKHPSFPPRAAAEKSLPGWGTSYLLPLVEALAVTVGEVDSTGHHPLATLQLLQGRLHVPAARALHTGRSNVRKGAPHQTFQLQKPPLVPISQG